MRASAAIAGTGHRPARILSLGVREETLPSHVSKLIAVETRNPHGCGGGGAVVLAVSRKTNHARIRILRMARPETAASFPRAGQGASRGRSARRLF